MLWKHPAETNWKNTKDSISQMLGVFNGDFAWQAFAYHRDEASILPDQET